VGMMRRHIDRIADGGRGSGVRSGVRGEVRRRAVMVIRVLAAVVVARVVRVGRLWCSIVCSERRRVRMRRSWEGVRHWNAVFRYTGAIFIGRVRVDR